MAAQVREISEGHRKQEQKIGRVAVPRNFQTTLSTIPHLKKFHRTDKFFDFEDLFRLVTTRDICPSAPPEARMVWTAAPPEVMLLSRR